MSDHPQDHPLNDGSPDDSSALTDDLWSPPRSLYYMSQVLNDPMYNSPIQWQQIADAMCCQLNLVKEFKMLQDYDVIKKIF